MTSVRITAGREWQAGWKPLLAGFAGMSVGWNVATIAAGLFLKPMQAEFGWSRSELSFGAYAALIVAVLLPFCGQLMDRVGARLVAITGVVALASAWALLSLIPARHDAFWVAVIWLGMAGGISNSIVFARGVTPWFGKDLGLAIGIMMTGASVGAALGIPVLSAIIHADGWRAGTRAAALATVVIGLPLSLLWFRGPQAHQAPQQYANQLRGTLRQIFANAEFWKLAAGCALAALPIGGFVSHLVPLLTDQGLPAAAAAGTASSFAVSVGIGRIANGALMDRLHPPMVVFVTLAIAACGVASIVMLGVKHFSSPMLVVVMGLIGLAQGAEGDYIKFFSMRLFGLPNFARVVALMAMTISLGMALGGLLFAWIYDHYGSYQPALYAGVLLYLAGGACFLGIRMRPAAGAETAR